MSIRFVRFCRERSGLWALGALSALAFFLAAPASRAQGPAPPPADASSGEGEPGDRKLPLESVLPYSAWKHHAARKAEEALVPVYVTQAGSPARTLVTGLVIRCDGFVLVPRAVRDAARAGGRIEAAYPAANVDAPAGAEPVTSVTPVMVAARYHPGVHASVPYTLIKTNGSHVRSLPLLASASVTTGKPVRLLWFTEGVGGAAARPVMMVRSGAVGPPAETRDSFSITPEEGSAEAIPSGAIVADGESGAAVGMVTQGGTNPAFITLARFPVIASEVGLAPDRAAVRLGDSPGTLPPGTAEMVWIPGGPVALDGTAAKNASRDFGAAATVACTPGFWMAVQPVTNGEYRTWLKGKGRPLPFGWSEADLYNPVRRADRPACGMFPEDAGLYAASRQSRLPTEVEWRRAAYTRDTAWVEERNLRWNTAAGDVLVILEELRKEFYRMASLVESAARQRSGTRRNPGGGTTTVNVLVPSSAEMNERTTALRNYVASFLADQDVWGQVHLIDGFRQDKSVFGVRNVVINAPELVLSRQQETLYAPKLYPARVDPDLTRFDWSASQGGTVTEAQSIAILRDLLWSCLAIISWRGGAGEVHFMGSAVSMSTSSEGSSAESLTTRADASIRHQVYAGFRCAR